MSTLDRAEVFLVSSHTCVIHLVVLFAATKMAGIASSIFTMERGNRPWTQQFMMKRLQKVFPEDDAANLIFYGGLNHVCYAVTDGDKDNAVSYGSAYYVNTSEYTEQPMHVPLKEGQRFRPPQRVDICEGNSSPDEKTKQTYHSLSKKLILVNQEHGAANMGFCQFHRRRPQCSRPLGCA